MFATKVAAMHADPVLHERARRADAIYRWAALEGKSRTMSDDLCRRNPGATLHRGTTRLAQLAELGALAFELARLLRSG